MNWNREIVGVKKNNLELEEAVLFFDLQTGLHICGRKVITKVIWRAQKSAK
jgi:hypothetical protein